MKTRRNRKGGAGGEVKQEGENTSFLSNIGNVLGLNKDTKPETQQSIPEAQGQPIQEASPIDPNAQIKDAQAVPVDVDAQIKDAQAVPVDVDAQIKADAQAAEAGPVLGVTARTGNANIDDEVAKLTKEEGYYFRAMINAIGVCNSTMKLKYNVLNPLNSEMFICGEECHKRADIIRKTIERFIPYLQQSDALGYIGSERVLANSFGYLGKSAVSLGSKAVSLGKTAYQDPRAAVGNVGSAVGKAAYNAPKAAYTGLTNVGKSAIAVGNYFTRKAPVQAPAQAGGRRRTRRR